MKKTLTLTPRWVALHHWLPDGPKLQILWDSEVKGLGVRVYPSGNQSWVLTYHWRGKQRWWNFGSVKDMTLSSARQFAVQALRDKANGLDPREPYMGSIKLNEAFPQWLNTRNLKPRTQKEYIRTYSGYVAPRLGNLSLKDIRSGMAQRLFSSVTTDHGPVTANRVVSMMKAVWNHFIKMEYLPPNRTNPWLPIQLNKEKPKERILSPEELTRLGDVLASPSTSGGFMGGEAVLLILSTGLRKGEVENLKWSEVDLSEEDVVLNLRDTKTGPRTVPLGAEASKIIASQFARKRLTPYVFSNKLGNKLNLQRVWEKIRKEADLEEVRLHDLRHTFASYAAGENQSLTMISQLLGHKHAHTSSRYVHAYRDPVVRAANQTSAAIEQHLWK
jgi:integrase